MATSALFIRVRLIQPHIANLLELKKSSPSSSGMVHTTGFEPALNGFLVHCLLPVGLRVRKKLDCQRTSKTCFVVGAVKRI
jgi:hypothetical protein